MRGALGCMSHIGGVAFEGPGCVAQIDAIPWSGVDWTRSERTDAMRVTKGPSGRGQPNPVRGVPTLARQWQPSCTRTAVCVRRGRFKTSKAGIKSGLHGVAAPKG